MYCQGFLQPDLVPKALEKLTRKLQGINEEFMKTLESLDALVSWLSQHKNSPYQSA